MNFQIENSINTNVRIIGLRQKSDGIYLCELYLDGEVKHYLLRFSNHGSINLIDGLTNCGYQVDKHGCLAIT